MMDDQIRHVQLHISVWEGARFGAALALGMVFSPVVLMVAGAVALLRLVARRLRE